MAGVRQFDEERLLADALAQFWRKGYAATSMQELAAASGVQRGSLYNAYGGKEALFIAAYRRYQARYIEGVRRALAPPDLRAALTGLFAFSIDYIRTERRGCLTTKTAIDEEAGSPAIRAALRQQMGDLHACLVERLSRSAPALRLPVETTADLIVTQTRGIVVMERIHDDPARLKAGADALVGLLLKEAGA
ncbi:TetR/AcrR family transcriptional regulator [Ancylobacter amanitiformis]|uniref:AcrR family transcriptional regulator n=1 Tax=Ancylobacter amanitiformis TaxID=217069 RepID=A0ABU0LMW8_9HYPH|nr:TetR/AcrR family transcriptional regulator [Ancylobacter amanitiformis]MDQ0510053.1 AcrR family transcriptional regulator [Ancylobacter amanitiformis]